MSLFRCSLLAALAAGVLSASAQSAPAPGAQITATVHAERVGEPIERHIYGQFIEHLGDVINRRLWAEMLDDRKFFYPVDSSEELQSPTMSRRRREPNRWRPIGANEFVDMDTLQPYSGEQTPVVRLESATPHGIRQAGLALQAGRDYTGRAVLAGERSADVTVSLVWGPNPADRQRVAVGPLSGDYMKVPFRFTAGADATDGRIEITGTGTGTFRIGAVSLMPADNVEGFRADAVALLRRLDSGFYRFPGGNFLSNHDWKDAIGDIDKRPSTWDYHWSALQPNDVGTDEFMVLCRLLNVEPYITVNAGFGEARSAGELVEYTNGGADTPFGRLRAQNGHPAPYVVKWWNVGNEPYGWWQMGHMALSQYTIKHNMFAKAMRKADPSITIIASGAMPDEMTVTTNSRRITGKVLTEFGSAADWTGGLLTDSWGYFDVLSEHWYCHSGTRFDLETGQNGKLGTRAGFVPVEESLIEWARRPANRVRTKAESWEEYLRRFPILRKKKIPVAMDEWAYDSIRPSLRLSLSYAWAFHEMFRHTDFIKMAAYTFATSMLDYNAGSAQYNTTGLLFQLYGDHYGTLPVEVTGNSPQPPPKWPVGGDQPRVNAGSDTYPLDVAAAFTSDRKSLRVAIVNPTESAQQLALTFEGARIGEGGKMWTMTGPRPDAANRLGQPAQVSVTESALSEALSEIAVPPLGVGIYELPLL